MNAQMVLTMGQDALLMLLMVSSPVLGAALLVGLLVSLFQAVTQIHEADHVGRIHPPHPRSHSRRGGVTRGRP